MDMVWVKSKITMPRTVPNAIRRKKLLAILTNNRLKKLIIIQAPAGYGKTTLLSQWFGYRKEPVAWFTIDRNDDEPIRFVKYLIHTLSLSLKQELNYLDERITLETVIDKLLNTLELYIR